MGTLFAFNNGKLSEEKIMSPPINQKLINIPKEGTIPKPGRARSEEQQDRPDWSPDGHITRPQFEHQTGQNNDHFQKPGAADR